MFEIIHLHTTTDAFIITSIAVYFSLLSVNLKHVINNLKLKSFIYYRQGRLPSISDRAVPSLNSLELFAAEKVSPHMLAFEHTSSTADLAKLQTVH
jgi:hypothetical protein